MRPSILGPAALLLLSITACGPSIRVDLDSLQTRIRSACDPMRAVKLRARYQTDVAARTAEVKAALDANTPERADALTSKLESDCTAEAERRRQLAPLIELAARRREVIPDHVWKHFLDLCWRADYTNAIVCGETLAQGSPSGCDLAPAPDRGRSRTIIREPAPPNPNMNW